MQRQKHCELNVSLSNNTWYREANLYQTTGSVKLEHNKYCKATSCQKEKTKMLKILSSPCNLLWCTVMDTLVSYLLRGDCSDAVRRGREWPACLVSPLSVRREDRGAGGSEKWNLLWPLSLLHTWLRNTGEKSQNGRMNNREYISNNTFFNPHFIQWSFYFPNLQPAMGNERKLSN